jgi:YD repeat-containing protein
LTQTDALNQTTTYTYNATNDLLSVTDPLGRTTQYGYDAAGNLIRITDALNNVTTYGYDAYGQRTRATDANNNTTLYAYNSAGYLVSTTDALNNVTQYGYDAVGNRTSVTDALNRTTTFAYDANNRLTQINALLGATTRYEYDANSNRTAMVDALNQRTTFTYDAFNRQTAVTDALNQTTQYQYDANGNRTRVIDANGNATNYQYDALNRLIRVTDALNYVTQYQYDAVGNRTSVTDARGNTTTSTYDALNRVTAVTIPITGTTTGTTRYEYDAVGNRTRVTDANNNATNYQYDALNRVTRVTDAQGNATQYAYDAVGNRMSITDAANQTTTYAYDALNRVTTITHPSGKTQTFTYDAVGNRLTATDEISQTTRYSYDALNRVISVTDPLTQTTTYAYNAVGSVTTITNPTGQATIFVYDAVNRLTRKTTPLGTTQYAYDAVGNLRVLTDPSGATTTYTYDAVNRVIQQDDRAPDGTLTVSYAFAYDANGNRTQETEARPGKPYRMMNYAYNKANWLVATTDPGGGTTTYNYDAAGNRTSVTDPLGVTTATTPNAVGLPAQTTHTQGGTVRDTTTFTYDARNNPQTQRTVASSLTLTTTTNYNSNNYLSTLNNSNQGTLSMSSAYTVTYANNNLVASVSETPYYYWDTTGPLYYYDAANRLICTDRPHLYGRYPVFVQIWKYDAAGRRTQQFNNYIHPPVGLITCPSDMYGGHRAHHDYTEYTYEGNKLIYRNTDHYYAGDFNWHVSDSTYNYDAAGNLTREVRADYTTNVTTTLTYGWTWQGGAHRLSSFTSSSGITATFDYDSAGRITRRYTAQGYSDYTYEDGTNWLLRETWHAAQSGNVFDLVRYWYVKGRPSRVEVASVSSDLQTLNGYSTYYLQYNWHGDVVVWVAPAGDGTNSITLTTDPWGVYSSDTFQYYLWNGAWGYLYFSPLKLYYVHGRWYNPETALWLSPDENDEYLYGSGQDAINEVWTQFVTGAAYQALKNNADAIAIVLFVSPGYRTLYEQTFNNIEETLPDTFPFRFGRLFGTTVTLVQGLGEITTLGPGIIGGGSAATCLATVGGGCIPGVSVSTAVGSAVIVHGLSVEAASLYNGSQLIIAFAKKSGSRRVPHGPYSHLDDPPGVGPGKDFTEAQKRKIIEENKRRNGGVVRSDKSGELLIEPSKSQAGVTPPENEWQIDHIIPKEQGGTNSYSNAQVLSRKENRAKWNR